MLYLLEIFVFSLKLKNTQTVRNKIRNSVTLRILTQLNSMQVSIFNFLCFVNPPHCGGAVVWILQQSSGIQEAMSACAA